MPAVYSTVDFRAIRAIRPAGSQCPSGRTYRHDRTAPWLAARDPPSSPSLVALPPAETAQEASRKPPGSLWEAQESLLRRRPITVGLATPAATCLSALPAPAGYPGPTPSSRRRAGDHAVARHRLRLPCLSRTSCSWVLSVPQWASQTLRDAPAITPPLDTAALPCQTPRG